VNPTAERTESRCETNFLWMSSPLKLMSTSYISGSLDDEDVKSMEGEIEYLCRHKSSQSSGKINIFCIVVEAR